MGDRRAQQFVVGARRFKLFQNQLLERANSASLYRVFSSAIILSGLLTCNVKITFISVTAKYFRKNPSPITDDRRHPSGADGRQSLHDCIQSFVTAIFTAPRRPPTPRRTPREAGRCVTSRAPEFVDRYVWRPPDRLPSPRFECGRSPRNRSPCGYSGCG